MVNDTNWSAKAFYDLTLIEFSCSSGCLSNWRKYATNNELRCIANTGTETQHLSAPTYTFMYT